MGRKPTIDEETGLRLVEAAKRLGSRRAAAKELRLSIGSVNRYFESLPASAAPVIADPLQAGQQQVVQRLVARAGADLWDLRATMERSYARIEQLTTFLEEAIQSAGPAAMTTFTPKGIEAYVAAIKEGREHAQTSMKLMELIVSVDEVRKFQEAVLEEIGKVDESVRREILANLKRRRAAGLALIRP